MSIKPATISVFRNPSNFSNGNILDREGNILTAQHDSTITKTDKQGNITVVAKEYNGKRLNSPNDLVLAANGDVYFSDPHYGLMPGFGPQARPEEQSVRGIYRLKKDGTVELLSGGLEIPNGLEFSPKGDILYAANTAKGEVNSFTVNQDGTLSNLKLFVKLPGKNPVADGIKIDVQGNLYAASENGVAVYTPAGKFLGEISLSGPASNLTWGGKDYKTLYVTAHNKVYSIPTLIGGNK